MSYINLLNKDTFCPYSLLSIHIINNTTDLIRKVFKYLEAVKLSVVKLVFQNSEFRLKVQILSLATIQSVVILEVSELLRSFSRKCLPNAQVWISMGCLSIVLSVRLEFSQTQTNADCFSWRQPPCFSRQQKGFVYMLLWILREMCPQGLRLNKTNTLHCFIFHFFKSQACGGKENNDY